MYNSFNEYVTTNISECFPLYMINFQEIYLPFLYYMKLLSCNCLYPLCASKHFLLDMHMWTHLRVHWNLCCAICIRMVGISWLVLQEYYTEQEICCSCITIVGFLWIKAVVYYKFDTYSITPCKVRQHVNLLKVGLNSFS